MKHVTQTLRNGKVQIADVPVPSLRRGGVLVQNAFSLISSGTERAKVELARKSLLSKALSRPKQVMQVLAIAQEQSLGTAYRKVTNRLSSLEPLGYSCAGKVISVATDVNEFRVGDWVACAGSDYANHAEIIFVPKNLCVKLTQAVNDGQSRAVTPEEGAFATVGAIALQGLRQADTQLGETVVIIGLGLLGLLTVQLVRAAGCYAVGLDPNRERCQRAASLGCCVVAQDEKQLIDHLNDWTSARGADAVILTAATCETNLISVAGDACREKGRVVIVGDVPIQIPRSPFYEKELEVRMSRSYGPGRYDSDYEEKGHDYPLGYVRWTENRNMQAFLQLVAQEKVRLASLITHRFPIQRAVEAYDLILEAREPCLGILLEYPISDVFETDHQPIVIAKMPSPSRPPVNTMVGEIGIALVGGGNFAQDVLLPAIKANRGVHLRGVVTQSSLRARDIANRFGFDYCSTNIEDVLGDSNVHAVIIATRHDTHAAFALQALHGGKAVFVEKPLSITHDQLEEIARFWDRTVASGFREPCLMVGFNRRFAELSLLARQFLSDLRGPFLLSCRVNAGYLSRDHWLQDQESGGGRIIGEGCHFVDLLMFLTSSFPKEVHAQALPDCGGLEENVLVQFRFANESLATLLYTANGDKRVGKERLEIFGCGGTVILDDFRRLILSRPGRRQQIGHWWSKQDKGHRAEIRAFLEAIRNGQPSPTPFQELLRSTATTLSISDSLRSGTSVSLNDACFPIESL